MMTMFGMEGKLCRTVDEIKAAFSEALTVKDKPSFINIMISPTASRKPQEFEWLTRSKV
jgi:2-hydroxyacyl-CoA lyase 1